MARRRPASPLLSGPEIDEVVAGLAARISADHPEGVVLVGVLKGSVCFLADLARRVTVPVRVDFMALTPYEAGSGRVRLVKDLDHDVAGDAVVVVEDLVDTGLTLSWLLKELAGRSPAHLAAVTLLDKPARRLVPVPIDYVGVSIPDVFVIGYGLDFAGRYRNLHGLWAGDAAELAAEPDCYVLDLYGR